MYCSNCGKQNDEGVGFCSNCGKSMDSVSVDKKNVIATGNGNGHGACVSWAILEIVSGIFSIVFFNWLASEYAVSQEQSSYLKGLGIIIGIACFVYAILLPVAISKTRITIYQDKVEGVGVSKYFMWGDPRTFNFIYSIKDVSIDVNGGKLIVHGQNNYYCVYVKSGSEIQNALWGAKKVGNTTGENSSGANLANIPPVNKNYGDTWTCKKCSETNSIASSSCKGCGEYK